VNEKSLQFFERSLQIEPNNAMIDTVPWLQLVRMKAIQL
jgi:hypothetical protein